MDEEGRPIGPRSYIVDSPVPKRGEITKDEIVDMVIDLNTTNSVEEFLAKGY